MVSSIVTYLAIGWLFGYWLRAMSAGKIDQRMSGFEWAACILAWPYLAGIAIGVAIKGLLK